MREGKGLRIGYFAQHQLETLRPDDSPLQHLARLAPDTREQELRDFLGSFNFSGEMATSKIAPFSGGEKARLALALIIWQKPNLLLLDEPTNHLDLETRHALTMALAQFEGTLILVSHDRHSAARHHRSIHAGREASPAAVRRRSRRLPRLAAATCGRATRGARRQARHRAAAMATSGADNGVNRKEQRRLEAETRQKLAHLKKPLQSRIAKIEKEMDALNAEKATLDAFVVDPASYEPEQKSKADGVDPPSGRRERAPRNARSRMARDA